MEDKLSTFQCSIECICPHVSLLSVVVRNWVFCQADPLSHFEMHHWRCAVERQFDVGIIKWCVFICPFFKSWLLPIRQCFKIRQQQTCCGNQYLCKYSNSKSFLSSIVWIDTINISIAKNDHAFGNPWIKECNFRRIFYCGLNFWTRCYVQSQ